MTVKKMKSVSRLKVTDAPPHEYVEPDEWYVAKFMKADTGEGQFGPYLKLHFKLLNGTTESGKSAKGLIVTRLMDATVCPGKPLYEWVEVMAGKKLKKGEEVNLTAYYGEKFRVLVEDRKKKKDADVRYQQIKTIKRRKQG